MLLQYIHIIVFPHDAIYFVKCTSLSCSKAHPQHNVAIPVLQVQKYQIYLTIHNPQSILCRSTFGSDLQLYLGKSLRAFHALIVQYFPIILFKILQPLSNWLLIIARQPFSGLAIDFQADLSQNCNSATQEHSLSSW